MRLRRGNYTEGFRYIGDVFCKLGGAGYMAVPYTSYYNALYNFYTPEIIIFKMDLNFTMHLR